MKIGAHLKTGCLYAADKALVAGLKTVNALRGPKPRCDRDGKRLLLYCPDTGGHRLSYAARLLSFYLDAGCEIVFAYRGPVQYDDGQKSFLEQDPALLESFKKNDRVRLVPLSGNHGTSRSELAAIVQLQREHEIGVTVFVDGDELTRAFSCQLLPGTPRLQGINYAVIISSEFFYLRDMPWRSFLKSEYRRYLQHGLFIKYMIEYGDVLDGAFYADENVIENIGCAKLIHVPELGHAEVIAQESPEARRQNESITGPYQEFLNAHADRQIILTFGDLEPRKGLEMLLRLCAERDDLALVRVGRTKSNYQADRDSIAFKEQLEAEDRIFERDEYIISQQLIDALFNSVDFVLLPYVHFYRTSSIMIQALSYGKPLLVPDRGLMYERVRKHHIGLWFEHQNYEGFVEKYLEICDSFEVFQPDIKKYYREFHSDEALYSALRLSLRDQ